MEVNAHARGKKTVVWPLLKNWRAGGNWHARLPEKQWYLLLWPNPFMLHMSTRTRTDYCLPVLRPIFCTCSVVSVIVYRCWLLPHAFGSLMMMTKHLVYTSFCKVGFIHFLTCTWPIWSTLVGAVSRYREVSTSVRSVLPSVGCLQTIPV